MEEDLKKEIDRLEKEVLPLFEEFPDLHMEMNGIITTSNDPFTDFNLKTILTAIRRILEIVVYKIYSLKYKSDATKSKGDLHKLLIAVIQKKENEPLVPERFLDNMDWIKRLANKGPHPGDANLDSVRVGLIYINPLLVWYSKNILQVKSSEGPPSNPAVLKKGFTKLSTLNTGFHQIRSAFVGPFNRLWVTDNEQLVAFNLINGTSVFRWNLPHRLIWKKVFSDSFGEGVICADWDGNLYLFNGTTGEKGKSLIKASQRDLPFHLFKRVSDSIFYAITWDGRIVKGSVSDDEVSISYCPLDLSGLPTHFNHRPSGGFVAVTDNEMVSVVSPDNKIEEQITCPDKIAGIWFSIENNKEYLFILSERSVDKMEMHSVSNRDNLKFSFDIDGFSHRKEDMRTALYSKTGEIDWLSWESLGVGRNDRTSIKNKIKKLITVFDPSNPNMLSAIGLSEKGQIFSVSNRETKFLADEIFCNILTDPLKYYILLQKENTFEVYYNPLLRRDDYEVEMELVKGDLEMNKFIPLKFQIKNVGNLSIYRFDVELKKSRLVETASDTKVLYGSRLEMNDAILLEWVMKPVEQGTLPLNFEIRLFNEIDELACSIPVTVNVKSINK